MDLTIIPGLLRGSVCAIPSKSQAHRLLICAAFADDTTQLLCPETNQDIEATADCLRSLGAAIERTEDSYWITPVKQFPESTTLNCRESGSTLRFMLPIAGALGINTTFILSGRLPQRPLAPLWGEMERMGCKLSRPTENTIQCTGRLSSGNYRISGSVSSQFITGLLFATALLPGSSQLIIPDKLESKPYVDMTQAALKLFGVHSENLACSFSLPFHSPGKINVEGDWSNGAFFLAAQQLGSKVTVKNLDPDSTQGDKAVLECLNLLRSNCTIDVADIPDLVPILSIVAAANKGASFTNIQRLRLKESDRVEAICNMLAALGISTQADNSTLTVFPGKIKGGTVDSASDHRIAMTAAIAATIASGPVRILNAQCVNKSYPAFWQEYENLGGQYEQYIR